MDPRQNKKKFKKEFKNKFDKITSGLTGFLITCNQNREKNAIREAYNFLNKVNFLLFPIKSQSM